jgi:hypothetical protein
MQWDVASRASGGRVIEILSEHMLQGMLQGYTLTGRTGLFPSYEVRGDFPHTGCAAERRDPELPGYHHDNADPVLEVQQDGRAQEALAQPLR